MDVSHRAGGGAETTRPNASPVGVAGDHVSQVHAEESEARLLGSPAEPSFDRGRGELDESAFCHEGAQATGILLNSGVSLWMSEHRGYLLPP